MHAHDRLVVHLGIGQIALEVTVQPDPVHLPAQGHLLLAHHGNVVLRLAGHHTGVTANAGAQIHHHAPGVALVCHRRVKGDLVVARFPVEQVRVRGKLGRGSHADQISAFHAVVILGGGEGMARAHFAQAGSRQEPGALAGAQRVGVETGPIAHPARPAASVAQVQRDHVWRLAGQEPDRRGE